MAIPIAAAAAARRIQRIEPASRHRERATRTALPTPPTLARNFSPAKHSLANSRTVTMNYHRNRYATDPEYRERRKAETRRWCEANEPKVHASWLRRKYGLSLQDYDAILARQSGACGICRRKPKNKRLCVERTGHDGEHRADRGQGGT